MHEYQRAYLVGTHRFSFRAGKPAEIMGVVFVNPPNKPLRACYHIRFDDDLEDFVPISETIHFKIISEEDVRLGNIPAVIH